MIKGILGYNSQNDRYGLLIMDLWEIDGFHCGDKLDVWDSEKEEWISTRIEMNAKQEWYLVDTQYSGNTLESLKVKVNY